jgi:hypothetical protein
MVEQKLTGKFKNLDDFFEVMDENNHRVKAVKNYFEIQKKSSLPEAKKLSLLEEFVNTQILSYPTDTDLQRIKSFVDGQIRS